MVSFLTTYLVIQGVFSPKEKGPPYLPLRPCISEALLLKEICPPGPPRSELRPTSLSISKNVFLTAFVVANGLATSESLIFGASMTIGLSAFVNDFRDGF